MKKYELPKAEEVNVYKQKLEKIHAELSPNSNTYVDLLTCVALWMSLQPVC